MSAEFNLARLRHSASRGVFDYENTANIRISRLVRQGRLDTSLKNGNNVIRQFDDTRAFRLARPHLSTFAPLSKQRTSVDTIRSKPLLPRKLRSWIATSSRPTTIADTTRASTISPRADAYFGCGHTVQLERKRIKRDTIRECRMNHHAKAPQITPQTLLFQNQNLESFEEGHDFIRCSDSIIR